MTPIEWAKIRHFKREEWPKDPDKVQGRLVAIMDMVREAAGVPLHVHVAFDTDGHSANSMHYKGLAVDFHFGANANGKGLDVLDQLAVLSAFPFGGLGFYPDWKPVPGWHADIREAVPRVSWIQGNGGAYLYGWKVLADEVLMQAMADSHNRLFNKA